MKQIVRLTGKTQKGKNWVRINGATHTVKKAQKGLIAANANNGIFLDACAKSTGNSRWVRLVNDPDFKVAIAWDLTDKDTRDIIEAS